MILVDSNVWIDSSLELAQFVKSTKAKSIEISNECSFLTGQAHLKFRQKKKLAKGTVVGVLADFFIGAQALSEGMTVLTRDSARYKAYFPNVKHIYPKFAYDAVLKYSNIAAASLCC